LLLPTITVAEGGTAFCCWRSKQRLDKRCSEKHYCPGLGRSGTLTLKATEHSVMYTTVLKLPLIVLPIKPNDGNLDSNTVTVAIIMQIYQLIYVTVKDQTGVKTN
jgi:hypothetical protein